MINYLHILIICCIFLSTNIYANQKEWSYTIGISVKQPSLNIYEKDQVDPIGILTEEFSITPELGFTTNIEYFNDTYFGYKYVINFGKFEMNTQEVNLEDIDLGTSASGYYLYAMPVLVFNILKDTNNDSFLVGLGLGLGYLQAKGSAILTELTPQTKHQFSFSELTYSYGLFFEYDTKDWNFNTSIYGPEVIKGGYEYNLFDFGLTIKRKFSF